MPNGNKIPTGYKVSGLQISQCKISTSQTNPTCSTCNKVLKFNFSKLKKDDEILLHVE